MFRRLGQLAALAILSALLVYAPELFTAVSAPYRVCARERVLLRGVICSEDADAVSSLYNALEGFRSENPSVHLRVTRADVTQLPELADPLPDIYVYPPQSAFSAQRLFLALEAVDADASAQAGVYDGMRYAYSYVPESGDPLLCAVGAHARETETARALVAYLHSKSARTEE